METLLLRPLQPGDAEAFEAAFAAQGWNKPREQFERYYQEQQLGTRSVVVAEQNGVPVGYITVLPHKEAGPFAGSGWPELSDFNVLEAFQRRGIGTRLMDEAERIAFAQSNVITIGVGLHSGYGAAQRMYVRRGYVPDGSGVWYRDEPLAENASCRNDDDLVLYFSKSRPLAFQTTDRYNE
ncbi:MAG: GNAT family N-acetyltransferase [Acutalibacteraceae bacterium]|jgi:GNAT superfamily N-acetyltransferase